jgi:hypothetical protein
MYRFFCYTIICGKIYNFKKGKKSKKARIFGAHEISRRAKSFEKAKSKGPIEAYG